MSARASGIPAELAHEVAGARQAIDLPAALAPEMEAVLDRVLACSPYAADVLRRYPQVIGELAASGRLERANTPGEIGTRLGSEAAPDLAEEEFLRRLRVFRHRELVRIVWRDVAGRAAVAETLRDLSDLADAAIVAAHAFAVESLRARHGIPRTEDGVPCGLGIVAMGKLGGHELNFSSDVDLMFVFSAPGETDGPRSLHNEEYFRHLAQRIVHVLLAQRAFAPQAVEHARQLLGEGIEH